ncbi:MAG: UDP-N-acetylmuramoyl-L-alanyl-D-glutamate--2,6-diaminopimelate ligase [Deltaproteobacteria bacterium]|nr:UDP-N-acetylmuramoyl-L-alanyl-D-glutamate--2,6-diaminopimelate ligase [Deltaproteobacteria bacterium]
MKLCDVMRGILPAGTHVPDAEISGLAYDSRAVEPGFAFFALPGTKADGASFVAEALARGAAAVLAGRPGDCGAAALLVVSDTRRALALAAANWYGRPSRTMAIAGVTGTNGKSTTVHLVDAMAAAAGRVTGVVGTIEYRVSGRRVPATHTTPGPVELCGLLSEMRCAGVDTVAMEVSSHALEMRRADGVSFDVVAFTNLSRDHLDFHGDMQSYFGAKARLFGPLGFNGKATTAVINIDDPAGRTLAGETRFKTLAVSGSAGAGADVHPLACSVTLEGIDGEISVAGSRVRVRSRLIGRHNLMNIASAAGVAHALGVPIKAVEQGIAAVAAVPGRLDRVDNRRGVTCLVDYAHTDDALRNVLSALRRLAPKRIITVFGCGGDRDRGKRPLMGEAAAALSDVVVVTSDNPRSEDPAAIIAEILPGVLRTGRPEIGPAAIAAAVAGFAVIADRREAIATAVRAAGPGDTLLIAGKGHEDYQIVGMRKQHFDDREEAAAAFASAGGLAPPERTGGSGGKLSAASPEEEGRGNGRS